MICFFYIVHHFIITRFYFRRIVSLNIKLTEHKTHQLFFVIEYALPAWALLFCSVKYGSIKMKVLLVKWLAQFISEGVDQVPSQICFPIIHSIMLQQLFHACKKFRLANYNGVNGINSSCRK